LFEGFGFFVHDPEEIPVLWQGFSFSINAIMIEMRRYFEDVMIYALCLALVLGLYFVIRIGIHKGEIAECYKLQKQTAMAGFFITDWQDEMCNGTYGIFVDAPIVAR
jgi:hypothetical protein